MPILCLISFISAGLKKGLFQKVALALKLKGQALFEWSSMDHGDEG